MGLFLVIVGAWTFFGPVTLEEAKDICAGPITAECYIEALEPIEPVDYSKMND